MTSVRLRALAALLALAPAAALLAGSPAQAATSTVPALPTVKSATASKTAFVLGSKAGCSTISYTAVLSAVMPTAGFRVSGVGVNIYTPGGALFDGIQFGQVGTSSTYRGSLKFCGTYTPGAWHAEIFGAAIPTGASDDDAIFTNKIKIGISLKRPSTLTLDASPEPAKKGKPITAAGTLKIDGKLSVAAPVKIYFAASGTKTYKLMGTATTNTKGAYSKRFTAAKSGTWKATYVGNGARNSAAATDAVTVK